MYYLFFISFLITTNSWTPDSWRSKPVRQIPTYPNLEELKNVESQLQKKIPLVFAGECRNLQEKLAKASNGDGFLLFGGDCSESFEDFSVNKVRDNYKLMLQMNLILAYALGVPIIKIGRIGNFAKPRTQEFETINGKEVLTYRGDIINTMNDRTPSPKLMIDAYHQTVQTLNILRSFSSGGYADINQIHTWNIDYNESEIQSKYKDTVEQITKSLQFMKALGLNTNDPNIQTTNLYTSHEGLLLNYEEALTRQDSLNDKWYCTSAHMLWIGERTRDTTHGHVEFLRGLNNPIGIKISEKCSETELVNLIKILNPNNIPGRITLITRMGHQIRYALPKLIRAVQREGFSVVWCCDAMHGNNLNINGIKTRKLDDIKNEINSFFDVHRKMGSYPGGIHLELSAEKNITEVIGGDFNTVKEIDLSKNYKSLCDARLNYLQSLEIAFLIVERFKNK